MSISSPAATRRTRMGARAAGLLFSSLLVLGAGAVIAAPASASSTPSEAGASSCHGTRTVLPAYSEATTTTTSCYAGRSAARHGSRYAETNWATDRTRAYASDYYGAQPRGAAWEIIT